MRKTAKQIADQFFPDDKLKNSDLELEILLYMESDRNYIASLK